jgi:hypothetical protein
MISGERRVQVCGFAKGGSKLSSEGNYDRDLIREVHDLDTAKPALSNPEKKLEGSVGANLTRLRFNRDWFV